MANVLVGRELTSPEESMKESAGEVTSLRFGRRKRELATINL